MHVPNGIKAGRTQIPAGTATQIVPPSVVPGKDSSLAVLLIMEDAGTRIGGADLSNAGANGAVLPQGMGVPFDFHTPSKLYGWHATGTYISWILLDEGVLS